MSAVLPNTFDPPQVPGKRTSGGDLDRSLAKLFNFGANDRARFYDRMHKFTTRGRDVRSALEGAYIRYERDKDMRRVVWRDWVRGLQAGRPFHELIAPYISPGERMLLAAGEESGALPQAFAHAKYVATAVHRIKMTLLGELFYPIVLVGVFIVLLIVVSVNLMPTMASIAPVESWPTMSKILYYTSTFFLHWWYAIIGGALAAIGVSLWSLPRWSSNFRRKLDKGLPPWSIYAAIESATLLINCAAMVNTGNSFDNTVKKIRENSSPWLNWHLDLIIRRLSAGKKPSEAMETGLIDKETMGDIQDYDDSGAFNEAIGYIGEDIVEHTIHMIKLRAGVLRAITLVAVAGGIVWTYASVGMLVMKFMSGVQGAAG